MMLRLRSAFNPDNRCSPRQDAADRGRLHRAEQGGAAGGPITPESAATDHRLHFPGSWSARWRDPAP